MFTEFELYEIREALISRDFAYTCICTCCRATNKALTLIDRELKLKDFAKNYPKERVNETSGDTKNDLVGESTGDS